MPPGEPSREFPCGLHLPFPEPSLNLPVNSPAGCTSPSSRSQESLEPIKLIGCAIGIGGVLLYSLVQ